MPGKLSKINLNDYKPLREVIFNSLREAIIIGELKPGERLMEVQLAEKMGVSRTPVREAIRKLELEGFVDMVPRKGAQVANLSIKDIMDVLEIRASLDSLAAKLAADKITHDELKELKNVYDQFVNYVEKENINGSVKKDVEFHEIIYKASRNEKLIQILNNLREQVQRFRIIYIKDTSSHKDLIEEHFEIYDALCKKDSFKAVKIAKEHIIKQQEGIIKAINEVKKNID
ncbi:MAG: GntR family transcriptional regulator [Clostridiales bacterium]